MRGCETHTLPVHDGHAGNVLLDEHVDDVHDRGVHGCCREIRVRANIGQLVERLAQLLCFFDVHGDELEDAILRYYADDHSPSRLVVAIYDGDTPRTRLEHLPACFVDGAVGVDGDGFDWLDAERLLDVWRLLVMSRSRRGIIYHADCSGGTGLHAAGRRGSASNIG
jgi:hypothetical protein